MRSRLILNLVLMALVVGLGWLVWWQPGKEAPEPEDRVSALEPAALERMEITLYSGEQLRLVKEAGRWQMRQPLTVPANEFRVDALSALARARVFHRFTVDEAELARYDLAPPRAAIRLNDTVIEFGGSEPLNHRRYIRVDGQVALINDRFFYHLQAAPTDYMSRSLVPPGARIETLTLPGLTLRVDAQGAWRLDAGRDDQRWAAISRDAINQFIEEWQLAQALELTALEPGEPLDTIEIGIVGAAQPLRFQVMETTPEWILARPDLGLAYHLTEEQGQRLRDPGVIAAELAADIPADGQGPVGEGADPDSVMD